MSATGSGYYLAVAITGWMLGASGWAQAAGPGVLYRGDGEWAVAAGLPPDAALPAADWRREGDFWIGQIPEGTSELNWGGGGLTVADAVPLPLAPSVLPRVRNAFGPCVVRSLSVRFESQIRAYRWSLAFATNDNRPDFSALELDSAPPVAVAFDLVDVESGQRWALQPDRRGVEGGMFEQQRGDARLYAGQVDEGRLEWHVIVVRAPSGGRILQARVQTLDDSSRRLRLQVKVESRTPAEPVLQDSLPPAIVAVNDGVAVALFMDLAEPRRYRAVLDEAGWMGMECDLALSDATGNFPRSATLSLEVDAWTTTTRDAARDGVVARLAQFGGVTNVPAAILNQGLEGIPAIEPVRMELAHPAGFRDNDAVLRYLLMRMSGVFPDYDWAASAFISAAQDAVGRPRIERQGTAAGVLVNPDPDLDTMLNLGQNRGLTVLAQTLQAESPAVWIRTVGQSPGLDHHARALYLCDYPAVWDEETHEIGVDLGHAEAELVSSLSCALKKQGVALLVEDDGPMAPFTTVYADGLVCASDDPREMRRQHALAGGRPVIWIPSTPSLNAQSLARDLGFASFPKIQQD